ncbi:MAG: hypothetical protein Kow0077_02830 [Anaerolineae bacterium]
MQGQDTSADDLLFFNLAAGNGLDAEPIVLLVDDSARILGGMLTGVGQVAHLSELLHPPDDTTFAVWWAGQTRRPAEAASEPSTMRIRGRAGGAPVVRVSVSALPERSEYLIAISPVESYRYLDVLNALYRISLAVSHFDLERLLSTIREQLQRLLPLDTFFVAFHDKDAGMVRFLQAYTDGQIMEEFALDEETGLVGWVIQHGEPLNVSDITGSGIARNLCAPRFRWAFPIVPDDSTDSA